MEEADGAVVDVEEYLDKLEANRILGNILIDIVVFFEGLVFIKKNSGREKIKYFFFLRELVKLSSRNLQTLISLSSLFDLICTLLANKN